VRRAVGHRLRVAVHRASHDLEGAPTPTRIERFLREKEPAVYAEWQRVTPAPVARQEFLRRLLEPGTGRRSVAPRSSREVALWPIGSRQLWTLLASRGGVPGQIPADLEGRFYLHNYGSVDADEVQVDLAGLWQEFVPRIGPRESVEIEWSEERVSPTEPGLPPAEDRGYPDAYDPKGEHQERACELRVQYLVDGRPGILEGLLYYWPGAVPTFFQLTGTVDAPDWARQIR
jgi:hypothetical protein